MEIYVMYALSVKDNKEKKVIEKSSFLYFSSKEMAAQAAKEFKHFYAFLYDPDINEKKLYCIVVEGYELDSIYTNILSTQVYSPDGQVLDSCLVPDDAEFLGRKQEVLFHQPGDLIETPCGEELCIGIIVGQPPVFKEDQSHYGLSSSDDAYTIIKYPSLEIDYAYAPLVFRPMYAISAIVRRILTEAWKDYSINKP